MILYSSSVALLICFFFQEEAGIRVSCLSRGLGEVFKCQRLLRLGFRWRRFGVGWNRHFANGHVELETRHFGGKVFLGFCTEFFHSGFDLDCSRGAEGAEWSDGDHSVETSFTIGISTIDGFSRSSADRVVIVSLDCEGGTSCQEKQTA